MLACMAQLDWRGGHAGMHGSVGLEGRTCWHAWLSWTGGADMLAITAQLARREYGVPYHALGNKVVTILC